jgi:hypothetical protein
MVMKSYIFWDIKTCSPLKINRRFEGTCRLHLQGRKITHIRNQHEAALLCLLIHAGLFFDLENGRDIFLRNIG